MRTKYGTGCDGCKSINSPRIVNNSCGTDIKNPQNSEIYIVTNIEKYGLMLYQFIEERYGEEHKIFILNNCLCEHSESDEKHCTHCCYSNCRRAISLVNAKYSFTYKLDITDGDYKEFENFQDLDSLKKRLDVIYNKQEVCNVKEEKPIVKCKYHTFNIPEKYYTPDYRLVDIQYITFSDKLLYIFRDKSNKRSIYEFPASDNFYWYNCKSTNRIIEKLGGLNLVAANYKKCKAQKANKDKKNYGADVNICTQHCVDYYLKTDGECLAERHNVMFFDIETYQYHDRIFPNANESKYPIVAISFRTDRPDDNTHVYLLALDGEIDNRIYDLHKKYKNVTIFKDEITMLKTWFARIKQDDIDILSAYNGYGFDFPYIINRVKNLGIDESVVNGYGNIYGDTDRGSSIPGYILLDQLKLYKEFTHGILPSYSLNNVATRVLGKEKVQHVDKSIDDMYSDDMDLYLQYSTTDTDLIYQLEQELGHISLQCEIRRVATCSHQQANTTLGQADGIYATAMKKHDEVGRNYIHDVEKEKLDGAYVFDPRPGLYTGLLCDFDFKSLYPSIICTWNIGPDTYIAKISKEDAFMYIFFKDKLKNKKINIVLDPLYGNKKATITFDDFEKFMQKYDAQITIIGTIFCGHSIKESINYSVLNGLMKSRSEYKSKMLEAKEKGDKQLTVAYNDKQLAFKIIANALYGALGQEHFRFYNPILGESITATGQEMIKYSAVHTDYFMEGKYGDGSDLSRFTIDTKFAERVTSVKNVVYGDTDSIFVYLTDYLKKKKLPIKKCPEVLDSVKDVQNYINKVILPTLLRKHNVKDAKSQMYLKNEFLMDRYYALDAKKKYASHVISQEGKSIDEIDIKGLEIKRSEIPLKSQNMLKDILNVIMDDKNTKQAIKSKVKKITDVSRKEITDLAQNHDVSIARVVSYSKKLEEYKVMPQHLLAMLTWNELYGIEEFKYGTKGKLFNVLGLDLSKAPKNIVDNYYNNYIKKFPNTPIKAIVVPENIKKLPDYFVVDLNTTVAYCCDDRIERLMSGLYVESDTDLLF